MRELALFAGAGGGLLGTKCLGWTPSCAVEIDPYCREVLLKRQSEGYLPRLPIWDDIRTFNGNPWRGSIDVVSGGFPCQGFSAAGKGNGFADPRSALAFEMLRVIKEVRPRVVLAENSPHIRTKGLGVFLHRLARMGYDAVWGVLGAGDAGAPHERKRLWVVATDTNSDKLRDKQGVNRGGKTESRHYGPDRNVEGYNSEFAPGWPTEPDVGRVAHGVVSRVDRLRAIGNGQVPAVVRMVWEILASVIDEERQKDV